MKEERKKETGKEKSKWNLREKEGGKYEKTKR